MLQYRRCAHPSSSLSSRPAMASALPALLLLAGLVFFAAADSDCGAYFASNGVYRGSQDCSNYQFCCGTCDERYCCYDYYKKLEDDYCAFSPKMNSIAIGSIIGGIIFMIVLFVVCCVCPCCCLYKLCKKPRPVLTTTTHTTVISSQYPQQPTNPGPQYTSPAYQHVPAQPGYGAQPGYPGQPMPPAPYQGQPYAPGAPPPYHESGYPAPYSQAAYDGGHPPYPLQPPTQPGYAQPPPTTDYSATQPPYNPAYVEPPKTGY
uniref:Protein shisa-5 n=2 Tax=Astyanax mexicanus TaxID=7994 RepID=A0A8B9JF11_ASTMX